jgi:hypothetical protein
LFDGIQKGIHLRHASDGDPVVVGKSGGAEVPNQNPLFFQLEVKLFSVNIRMLRRS